MYNTMKKSSKSLKKPLKINKCNHNWMFLEKWIEWPSTLFEDGGKSHYIFYCTKCLMRNDNTSE